MGKPESVLVTMEEVLKMMRERDTMKAIEKYLLRTDPQVVLDTIKEGKTIPKYMVDLIVALTKLYDAGYSDAKEKSAE